MRSNLLLRAIHGAPGCPPTTLHRPAGVASLSVTTKVSSTETRDEFTERMAQTIDNASLALLMSVGHQTGLLDTMAGLPPSTSRQIATAAGLNERYVREWLGGMTTGHIVDYDADD